MVINFLQSMISGMNPDLVIIFELGVLMIIATFFALLVKMFKQPIIPGYIIAGILIGPLVLGLVKNQNLIYSLSEIGVAFLIFTAGLEIKFKKLKEVGSTVAITGILQVIITFAIAFFVSTLIGFGNQTAIYVGLAVAFSSTMIVVKILSDKREINSLHGRIIIGILLIQDIAAIIALMIISSDLSLNSMIMVLVKALLFSAAAFIFSKAINPVMKFSAKHHELLLLVSISFLFLFIIGSFAADLSLVIGAFFAGVSLANSDYKTEIEGKIGPLREFFAVIFFVALGMQIKLINWNLFSFFLILLGLVIIIKPLIVMLLVRVFGYKKSTSFLTGNALAQTSEFSLVIITLGMMLGHIDQGVFSTLVLLTVLTMSSSSYMVNYEKKLLNWFGWPLNLLNRIENKKENLEFHETDGKKILIFGCHRMGSLFVKEFEKNKKDIFVVDYNPEIIKSLMSKKIPCIYGDFANEEVFEKTDVRKAKIVISTIPDLGDNLMLIKKIRQSNKSAVIFISAERISDALELYKAGTDYVILPQVIGGQRVSEIIKKIKGSKEEMKKLKKEHIKYLGSIHNILY